MTGSQLLDCRHIGDGEDEAQQTYVVIEEPLETRLDDRSIAVTMRTPGHDVELALGFLITEGVVREPGAIASAAACLDNPNVVDVRSAPGATGIELPAERHFFASSSCGLCGKATLDAIRVRATHLAGDALRVSAACLARMPERMRAAQPVFEQTGAVHAAALFAPSGELVCLREDVGRHNAVDKIVGWAALEERLPLSGHVLLASGRAGFEIVQKALLAGIPLVAAISGPTALAVELARDSGMTLVAFLRGEQMNVYCGAERITLP